MFENVELITRRFCASITDIPCPVRTRAIHTAPERRAKGQNHDGARRSRKGQASWRTVVAVADHVAYEDVLAGAVGVPDAGARGRRGWVFAAVVAVAGPHRDAVPTRVLDTQALNRHVDTSHQVQPVPRFLGVGHCQQARSCEQERGGLTDGAYFALSL